MATGSDLTYSEVFGSKVRAKSLVASVGSFFMAATRSLLSHTLS
jgi:hypothetical protein